MDLCFGIEIRAAMSDEFEDLDATEKAGIRAALIRCRELTSECLSGSRVAERADNHIGNRVFASCVRGSFHHAHSLARPTLRLLSCRRAVLSAARPCG